MSKLLDSIEAHQTDRHYPKKEPLRCVSVEQEVGPQGRSATLAEYSMRVTLETKVKLGYPWTANEEVKERARVYLAEHVFGEFREHIIEIRKALWDCDYETGLKWIDQMEERMFRS